MLADFQICMRVPLTMLHKKQTMLYQRYFSWDLLRIIKTKLVENTYNGVLLLSVFLNILIQRFKTSFILNMF